MEQCNFLIQLGNKLFLNTVLDEMFKNVLN